MRDFYLDAEFLDSLLEKVPPIEDERVVEEQALAPHSDIGEPEESGARSPMYCRYYLNDTTFRSIYVFRAVGYPFNTLTSGSIHTDLVDIAHSYVSKIRALLEKHIWEAGARDSVKLSIVKKYF